ncbi:SAM-dependent methyltransferase [Saccharothrix australiensis]|uniref:S-adenosyl methyltransferase n=1 Tax=Saccharothrix australiensis TaxID=2072 RepID=A0A495VQD5_9PSEU|nr:SAM-dependent methyltransferase [Saccharothrix australiensis]RKT51576.1 S-adenosyl methyltransferase [Saccharothrix australiensis]
MEHADRPAWAPGDVDLGRPSIARVYDYWLGGAHNFAVDRAVGDKVLGDVPVLKNVILNHRAFLRRAVRYLLARGIRQFLDLGSGIPTVGNVHEIAQAVDPTAKVVYVDIDPVAVAHSRAILTGNESVAVLQTDVRDARGVLKSPEVRDLLDFDRPIAVLMVALLHFVPDSDDPGGIVAAYRDAIPPGSYLALSHAGYEEGEWDPAWDEAKGVYNRGVSEMTYRTKRELEAFFAGFDLVEPGVARLPLWHPESPDDVDGNSAHFLGFGAMGRKP